MANTIKLGNGNWATKEGSLLAYNDENNNFKPLPFTTTRASSATVVNKQGLIETVGSGIPRIDFSDNSDGALLLEGTATNLFTYSEDFSNASWKKNEATVTITNEISPNGTTNNVYNYVGYNSNLYTTSQASGAEYTISFYVKSNGQGADGFKFRLGSGYSASLSATSEWVRHTFTATPATNVFSITSDGVGDVNILVWGAQLEANSYATSYIKTVGTTQTRVADTASGSGNSTVINSTEGVLYVEASTLVNGQNGRITISDGTLTNRVSIEWDILANTIKAFTGIDGNLSTSSYDQSLNNKIAVAYKQNDLRMFINGVKIGVDLSTSTLSSMDRIDLSNYDNTNFFYGKTKSVQVYTTALSDAELTTLTTI